MPSTLQTALVSGAGSGIGRSIATTLAGLGLRIALVGRDREKLERNRSAIGVGRDSALIAPCDVTDRVAVEALVNEVVGAFGTIDVLVCNAGINVKNRSLESLDPADWDRMIATNLTGASISSTSCCPSCVSVRMDWSFRFARCLEFEPTLWAGRVTPRRSTASQPSGSVWVARKGPMESAQPSSIREKSNTPILDQRPVPVGQDRRMVILQPEDIAAAVRFLVELPPRARVPELVIMPTVDDFC